MGVPLRTEITPETIEFKSRYERQTVTFEIKNNGEGVQMYKIKTTNSKDFKIKPVYFSIEKNEKRKVNVTYNGKIEKANSKDRITVVYGHQINLATTVEQAWEDQRHLQNISMVEKRKYVKIAYRENAPKKPDDSITASKTAVPRSVTVKPVLPSASQMSGINRDQDSYFAIPPGGPAKIPLPKKKTSSRMEVNEGTTEDGKNRGYSSKSKKNNDATQTADASQEDGEAPPPPVKKGGGTRRKVPPPPQQEEEEEDAPKTAVPVPLVRRKQQSVEEEPPRPKTRKAPPPPPPQEEEEEEEAPPPPKVTPKKIGTRRKVTPTPPPPPPIRPARSPAPMAFNDEDEATELDAKPISKIVPVPTKKTQPPPKPKSKRKKSSSFDPLASLMNDSKIIYVVQQPSREDDDEEESERKPKKKSKENKKKTAKRKEEEDEDEEQ